MRVDARKPLAWGAMAALALAGAACNNSPKPNRQMTGPPPSGAAETGLMDAKVAADSSGSDVYRMHLVAGGVQPGIHPHVIYGERHNPYGQDKTVLTEGRRLFTMYNCSGCHGGHAGGGMGPSLRDSLWSYGNTDTQLFATITEGRPAGMPAWGPKIPEDQIWKLISYIRSLETSREPDKVPLVPHEVKIQ
ncbi:MAG TPA: c-type cytochrome [Gemmatimonadales bacterium]|nr:c-type cytochrome [Gemmatimonadales bacterium]